jgi:sugar phosphate isomerase/epimerase
MTSALEITSSAPAPRFCRGFSTLGCGELTLAEISALATRFGVRDLELRVIAGRLDLPAWFNETGLDAAAELLASAGQRVVVLGTSVRLFEGAKGLDELRAFAGLAQRLDCPWLRIFDGGPRNQPPRDAAGWQPALDLLAAWRDERAAAGWTCDVLIETHDALVTSPSVVELSARAQTGLNILWDSHHTWAVGGEAIADTWRTLRPWIRHIHVKDSAPAEDSKRAYVLPGRGDYPFGELHALLRADAYDGVLSLEWERHWHPHLPALPAALTAWINLPAFRS